MSVMAIIAGIVLCSLSLFYGFRGQPFMGRTLGGDFAGFYVTGKILNEYEPSRLYDLDLEIRLQHEPDVGMIPTDMLPYAQAPYAAQLLRIFALLPYRWAYVAWLAFSLALYTIVLSALLRVANLSPEDQKTGFLLGVGSVAFIIETWIGGQLSVVGFFLIAMFFYLRAKNREFLAGLVLSLALYKVTLVAIPVLMLLCGRQWRILRGFVVGATAVSAASIATVGAAGCLAWWNRMRFFRYLATGPLAALRRTKYVDVGSFLHLLFGDSSAIVQILGTAAAAVGVLVLALAWWKAASWNANAKEVLWAATIAGSLAFNVYTPIYDTTLMAIPIILIARILSKQAGQAREELQAWIFLLYLVPWLTQSLAEFVRIQPLTLVLLGFIYWALKLARRQSAMV